MSAQHELFYCRRTLGSDQYSRLTAQFRWRILSINSDLEDHTCTIFYWVQNVPVLWKTPFNEDCVHTVHIPLRKYIPVWERESKDQKWGVIDSTDSLTRRIRMRWPPALSVGRSLGSLDRLSSAPSLLKSKIGRRPSRFTSLETL
jgi:hypothetical protein